MGVCLLGPASRAGAADVSDPPVLAPVTVTGTIENPATGQSTLSGEVIRDLPRGNGSINELLRVLPDVQFSEDFNTTEAVGEILPPNVSISGGKAFENNFLIDGIGNNSLLDPGAKDEDLIGDVPGHPQELFLDAHLVEVLTVYDSNIPAEFGGFTGGVVSVETRRPGPRPGGRVFYRTTRDNWTRFHLDEEQNEEAERAGPGAVKPEFEKKDAGAELNLPLTGSLGVLTAYRRVESDIPRLHLGAAKSESRRLENYFLKFSSDPGSFNLLDLTLTHAPYSEGRFFSDVRGSDFSIEGGGSAANLGWRRFFDAGELDLNAGFSESENSRAGPQHFRNWAVTDSKDWGRISGSASSREGGFGVVEKTQRTLTLKGVLRLDERLHGRVGHALSAGVEYEGARGTFDRPETTFVYKNPRLNAAIVCGDDTFACEEQEQFFTLRQVFDPSSVSTTIHAYRLFAEDLLRWNRLTLRPGAHLAYDDFMGNLNFAPRFTATYDLFADGSTQLIAGVNRYFSRSLLTQKLREAKLPFRTESRTSFQNQLTAWEPAAFQGRNVTRFSQLDTPYSDELALGVDQALAGGRLSLKYVHREGKDEFARSYGPVQPDGLRYFTLNNNGTSRHDSYRLSWERRWSRQFLSLNLTYQRTTTSNEDYDTTLETDDLEDRIWYADDIILKTELPRGNYNRPWVANLTWVAELPAGFSFSNFARYQGPFRTIEAAGFTRAVPPERRRTDPLTGEEIFEDLPVYRDVRSEAFLVFDWKLGWSKKLLKEQSLAINLEILNVLDERVRVAGKTDNFLLGRQFWAGAEYSF